MTLRLQLLLLQALIVCVVVAVTGIVAGLLQERAIRLAYQDRMQAVAQSVARLPVVVEAFDDPDPSRTIQPVAEVIREASDLAYVVVTDAQGIRFSHPNPALIGQRVSTDPSVPLSGQTYVGTQTGTLGTTWRVKVPIYVGDTVVGTASVGILESELTSEFLGNLIWLLLALMLSALVGVFGAAWVSALIRRKIRRLEPDEIDSLLRSQETTLHRLSEGVVVVNGNGSVVLVNDAAARLLERTAAELVGEPADAVLPPELVRVLEEGEPEGAAVLAGERVLVARSTGTRAADGERIEATLLLRDHTELHSMLTRVDAADAIIASRARLRIPKGLSVETLDAVARALRETPEGSAEEIGEAIGLSRVSTRRYLEHLAGSGRAARRLDHSGAGRPVTRYRALELAGSAAGAPDSRAQGAQE